jgi:hypothetical protein
VCSFDKPGIGESTGNWRQVALREETKSNADIARAVEFMPAIHVAAERHDDSATISRNLLDAARGQPWASRLTFDEADD